MKIAFSFFLLIYSRVARRLLGPHDTLPCVLIMNSYGNAMNSNVKVTNPIAKMMNSVTKGTNSFAKLINSIAKTCKNRGINIVLEH